MKGARASRIAIPAIRIAKAVLDLSPKTKSAPRNQEAREKGFYYPDSNAYCLIFGINFENTRRILKFLPVIGELESDVLEALKSNGGQGTASDVLVELRKGREVAYTTVSTTLDRLFRKHLLERRAMPGPGGTKYLFVIGKDEKVKSKIVESTMDRLTAAFGDTAYSAIYKHLDDLSEEELERLRKQVDRAIKAKSQ